MGKKSIKCPHCGQNNLRIKIYCSNCGNSLKESPATIDSLSYKRKRIVRKDTEVETSTSRLVELAKSILRFIGSFVLLFSVILVIIILLPYLALSLAIKSSIAIVITVLLIIAIMGLIGFILFAEDWRPRYMDGPTKAIVAIVLIVFLSLALILSSIAVYEKAFSLPPHNPIRISANCDFTTENGVTGGSGTISDPFIIENWKINSQYTAYGFSTYDENGIVIRDTTAHFVIRNTYLTFNGILSSPGYGIILTNVSNGIVENCTFSENSVGISIGGCSHIIIKNNRIFSNSLGIFIRASNCTVVGNSISSNEGGISLINSKNITVYNNNFIRNKEQASEGIGISHQPGWNFWCNDDSGKGNYWSDYDGMGDSTYYIPLYNISSRNSIDREPHFDVVGDNFPAMRLFSIQSSAPNWAMLSSFIIGFEFLGAIILVVWSLYFRERFPRPA